MNIAIVGTGFVGLTAAAVYAHFGNQVVGLARDQKKIDLLNQGTVSFYEPKLSELVKEVLDSKHLSFTTDYAAAIPSAEVVMICVGTPSSDEGDVDLSAVEASLRSLAPYLQPNTIIAIKSTVPPKTLDLAETVLTAAKVKNFHLASLPEFLKEGTAVDDTLYPDRVVIGSNDQFTADKLDLLHQPLNAPIIHTDPNTAQLGKYAANNYLASRIVFVNEIANVAEAVGANITDLLKIIGQDKRIGDHYWYPGLGYGGSCFPKDVKGLSKIAAKNDLPDNLFCQLDQINSRRPVEILSHIAQQIGGFKNKKIAVLGLSFKPATDDQRVSPALVTLPYLLEQGANLVAYDPMVKKIASQKIADHDNYIQVKTIDEALDGADIVLALVEWPQIIGYDFASKIGTDNSSLKPNTVFIDIRNQFSPKKLTGAGYRYFGIGR